MRSRAVLAGAALSILLAGCVGTGGDPADPAPIGPEPAPSGPVTLDSVLGIVGPDDAPSTMSFTPGSTYSTSGDDLASENDYWIAVGGTPDVCADLVAAPYLVSSADAASLDRQDDRSALLGTVTELDEERFGLVQVYAREFDGAEAAAAFLDGFVAAVPLCPAYQFIDDGVVTYDAVGLSVEPLAATGDDTVDALVYRETLSDPDHRTTVYFLRRDGVVISVYGEILPGSTLTDADIEGIAGTIAGRLASL